MWTHTVHRPDADFIKLHVEQLALGPDDRLRILDRRGRLAAEYSDRRAAPPGFWLRAVRGDTVTVELTSVAPGTALTIDRYGHGTPAISPTSVCGSDQTEDVACYAGTPVATASRAVGRMIFEQQGGLFACTGFLVSAFDLFLTALAIRSAKVTPAGGFLALRGTLTLGIDSNLIDPLAEPIALTVADADGPVYSVSLPAGAMRRAGSTFLYTASPATAPNGLRTLRLIPKGVGSYDVVITARRADLSGANREEVTITLGVGDDTGRHTVVLRPVPRGFLLP